MAILLDASGVLEETWTRADAPVAGRPTIVPLAELEAHAAWSGEDGALGADMANTAPAAEVAPFFDRLALVSVDFPSFADGRGFSLARALRGLGYSGRLRAAGPVIADQAAYLLACGFDEIEVADPVAERQPEAQWRAALTRISGRYQSGYGGRSILDARRAGGPS